MKNIYALGNLCNWQLEKQHASLPVAVPLQINFVQHSCALQRRLLMCKCL